MDSSLQLVEPTFAFLVICSESELIAHDDKLYFTPLDQATFIKKIERDKICLTTHVCLIIHCILQTLLFPIGQLF